MAWSFVRTLIIALAVFGSALSAFAEPYYFQSVTPAELPASRQKPEAEQIPDERVANSLRLMDSPKTDPKARAQAEHLFLAKIAGRSEAADEYGKASLKTALLKQKILKTLLYASGKEPTEKAKIINGLLDSLEEFFSKLPKSPEPRYVRIANEADRLEFLKSLDSGFSDLNEEFPRALKHFQIPAGALGDQHQIDLLMKALSQSKPSLAPAKPTSIHDIDPEGAEKIARALNARAIEKINEKSAQALREADADSSARKVLEDLHAHAIENAPKLIDRNLRQLTVNDLARPEVIRLIKSLPDKDKLALLSDADLPFHEAWQRMKNIGHEIAQSKDIRFANEAEKRFFLKMFGGYFEAMSFEESKNIIKTLIERPDLTSHADIFRQIVLHAGPQMQKLLQILAEKDEFSPELRKIFSEIQDQGIPDPWYKIEDLVKTPPEGMKWVSIDHDAKVGTIAQTYHAIAEDSKGAQKEIAIRVIKNDVPARMAYEDRLLGSLVAQVDRDPILRAHDFPLIGHVYSDIRDMAYGELHIDETARNQISAAKYYNRFVVTRSGHRIQFATPETYSSPNPKVLYSEWLPGERFTKFIEKKPHVAAEVAESIASHWLNTALYDGKFFHADLHQGNLKVIEKPDGMISVGILDFGMVSKLNPDIRDNLMKLFVSRPSGDSELIARYLWDLSVPADNSISRAELIKRVASLSKKSMPMQDWLTWALSQGLRLRPEATAFHRGSVAIEQFLKTAGSRKALTELGATLAMKNPRDSVRVVGGAFADQVLSGSLCRKLYSKLAKPRSTGARP